MASGNTKMNFQDWSGLDDDDSSSSVSSNATHVGVTRRSQFPPFLPTVGSSVSISKSLPQRLAATISAADTALAPRSKSARRYQSPSKSRSSSEYPRRLKSPPSSVPPDPPSEPRVSPTSLIRPGLPGFDNDPCHGTSNSDAGGEETSVTTEGESTVYYDLPALEADQDDSESESIDDIDEDDVAGRALRRGSLQRLTDKFSKLRSRRTALWDVFDGIRARRTLVQDLRQQKNQADRAFMIAVQDILPRHPGLDELFKSMQDAQLRCQEAEERFDEMIDELQYGEAELESEERRFYTAAAGSHSVVSDDESDDDSRSTTRENLSLRGITGDRPEVSHPLFESLREAFEDLQLAKELLVNTRMKRTALIARRSQFLTDDSFDLLLTYGGDVGKRRALELKKSEFMTEEDLEELKQYDHLEQTAMADIKFYTEQVQLLGAECREKGVVLKTTSFQQDVFGLDATHRDDIHLGTVPFDQDDSKEYPKTLAHPVFPTLLSNPTHLLESFPQTARQSLRMAVSLPPNLSSREKHIDDAAREVNIHALLSESKAEDKSDYINRWLLHKLHLSAMEAEVLWSTFRLRLKILDVDRWQRDVLHFWWRDPAANLPPAQFKDIHAGLSSGSVNPETSKDLSRHHSDSGQLDGLRYWDVDEAWP
ncbi:hypothetical protein F5X99DRAFT_173828 [Biscogniauxia marginata]|nr:hypothetical protein F5X99DRAFT_173828 [Biscogniauxia marginata]